jgi:hypothetical protein
MKRTTNGRSRGCCSVWVVLLLREVGRRVMMMMFIGKEVVDRWTGFVLERSGIWYIFGIVCD